MVGRKCSAKNESNKMAVKKIIASSIAEVVIALAIISLSFAMVARIFTQASRSTILFDEVREQTEIQGLVLEGLINDTLPKLENWLDKSSKPIETQDNLKQIVHFQLMSSDKLLFEQELMVNEEE